MIFPEAARYWGVADVSSPGVQAFGVLDLSDFSWWNPAWLYVRMGSIAALSWSMAQVWETLVAGKNVWQPSFRRGAAAFCMVVTVMMLGQLGLDMLGGTGKSILSMFPVYMIAYVLLASLAFAVLSAVFLRRLDGGKDLPWPRLGGMLTAMVLVKAYIVYSQYMITWYASIPAEMSFYDASASSGWSGMLAAALVLQLLLPFLILLIPADAQRPQEGKTADQGHPSQEQDKRKPCLPCRRVQPKAGAEHPARFQQGISRIMMNRTAAVFFLFSRRPGEYLPLRQGRQKPGKPTSQKASGARRSHSLRQ